MGLNAIITDIIEAMEGFLDRHRPPEALRDKVDLSYRIEDQSIIIFETRSLWNKPGEFIETEIAKTTYVERKHHWKIFWKRADLKWHAYEARPTVKTLREFTEVVSEDKHHCFWG